MGCSGSRQVYPPASSTCSRAICTRPHARPRSPVVPRTPPGPTGSQLLDDWLSHIADPKEAHEIVALCTCYSIIDDDILGELNGEDLKDLGVPKYLARLIPWTERKQFVLDDLYDLYDLPADARE
jgi:hypothetical protein